MTDAIQKFDPTSYVDKVRDKIKQSLIDIVPDEQWNAMLKTEISAFFEMRHERVNTYSNEIREVPSEFSGIVRTLMKELTTQRVRAILDGPEYQTYWSNSVNGLKVGEEIERIARENGAAIFSKWLEAAIGQVISQIRFAPPQ